MYLSLLDVGCVLVRVFDKSTVAKGVQRKLNTKKEGAKETKYQKRIIYIRVIERGGAREIEYIRYIIEGETFSWAAVMLMLTPRLEMC